MSDQNKTKAQLIQELETARESIRRLEARREAPDREMQKHLEALATDLKLAQRIAHVGSWTLDPAAGVPEWSDIIYDIYERDPADGPPRLDEYRSIYEPEQFDIFRAAIQAAIQEGAPYDIELRLRLPSGNEKWIHAICQPELEKGPSGHRLHGIIQDITTTRRAANALRESEEKYRLLHESAGIGVGYYTTDGTVISYNRIAAGHMNGRPEDFAGKSVYDLFPREAAEEYLRRIQSAVVADGPVEYEDRVELPGGVRWFLSVISSVVTHEQDIIGVQIMSHDVTERKQVEAALRESEAQNRKLAEEYERLLMQSQSIIQTTRDGFWMMDSNRRCIEVNQAFADMLGYTRDELRGMAVSNIDVDESADDTARHAEEIMQLGSSRFETRHRRKDGRVIDVEISATYLPDQDQFTVFARDVTERKEDEERLRLLEFSVEQAPVSVFRINPEGRFLYVNQTACRSLGRARDELIGSSIHDIDPNFPDEARAGHWAKIKQSGSLVFETLHTNGTGRVFPVEITSSYLKYGEQEYEFAFAVDITSRRETEDTLRTVFDMSVDFICIADNASGRFIKVNPAYERLLGLPEDRIVGRYPFDFMHPDDREASREIVDRHLREGMTVFHLQNRNRTADGGWAWIDWVSQLVVDRGITYAIGRDVTEIRKAEQEKNELQERLLHSQKMESIGRLAGGVAHDFNNLLTSITGNVILSQMDLSPQDPLYETLEEINTAAESAGNLTRQLLAFSRKQIIKPKVVDLDVLIDNMRKMLSRLIGEDVILRRVSSPGLGRIEADPGQLEQILVNLAVNARDAMPNGGRLEIKTANVTCDGVRCETCSQIIRGDFVMIGVSDNGTGIDDETRKRVFDPFYTTKKEGKGTGLGLAMVYGIVKQHNGHIQVQSRPGRGTRFSVMFPAVDEKADEIPETDTVSDLSRGTETILVVEDESLVRSVAVRILKRQGYQVHSADSGPLAMAIVDREHLEIDLLLTDIVMPTMNGRELADELQSTNPNLKVLYTSGYTEDVVAHHGVLDEGLSFIVKPYTPVALANKVREVLDG